MSVKIVTEKRIEGLEVQGAAVYLVVDESDEDPDVLLEGSDAYDVVQRMADVEIEITAEMVLNALADFRFVIVSALEHDLQEAHERIEALENSVKILQDAYVNGRTG